MANHLLVSCMAKLEQLKKGISQDVLADRQIFFSLTWIYTIYFKSNLYFFYLYHFKNINNELISNWGAMMTLAKINMTGSGSNKVLQYFLIHKGKVGLFTVLGDLKYWWKIIMKDNKVGEASSSV